MSMYVAYAGPVDGVNRLTMVVLDSLKGVDAVKVADLSSVAPTMIPTQAPGMCHGSGKLHIFAPANNNNDFAVHEVTFNPANNTFAYVGIVPGVSTNDRVAAVYDDNTATFSLFYQDSNVLKQAVRVGAGDWSVSAVNGAKTCWWGPAACYRGGAINLAYCSSDNQLKVGYMLGGSLQGISPSSNIKMWWSPALTDYQDPEIGQHGRILTTFVWQNTNNINWVYNNESSGWSNSSEINARNCVDGGPTTCTYNNDIYMFSQGGGNKLLYTVYTLQSWPDDNSDSGANYTTVKFKGNDVGPVWWAPVVVALD